MPLTCPFMSIKKALSTLNDLCSCGEIDFNFSNVSSETFFFISVSTSSNKIIAIREGWNPLWFVCFLCARINFGIEIRCFHKSTILRNKNAFNFCLKFVIVFRITPNFVTNLSKLLFNRRT